MSTATAEVYKVQVLDQRATFQKWIAERGGVVVWRSQDLSFSRGDLFTPLRDEQGVEYGKPHWAYSQHEVVSDIERFNFLKEVKELKRFRIALQRGGGFRIDLTGASTLKVRRAHTKLTGQHGEDVYYRFDGPEVVFEKLVFEK